MARSREQLDRRKVLVLPDQPAANLALASGRADVGMTEIAGPSPVRTKNDVPAE